MDFSSLLSQYKFLFWDVDTNRLERSVHKEFIISRILEKGNLLAIKIMFKVYSAEEISKIVFTSSNISTQTASFWKSYLDNYANS